MQNGIKENYFPSVFSVYQTQTMLNNDKQKKQTELYAQQR